MYVSKIVFYFEDIGSSEHTRAYKGPINQIDPLKALFRRVPWEILRIRQKFQRL